MRTTTSNNYSAIAILDYLQHSNIIIGLGKTTVEGLSVDLDSSVEELSNLVGYINPVSVDIVYENPLGPELIQGVRYSKVDTANQNRAYLRTYKANTLLLKVLIQHADILAINPDIGEIDLVGVYSDATLATGGSPIKTTKTGGNLDFIIKTKKLKLVDGTQTGINLIIHF